MPHLHKIRPPFSCENFRSPPSSCSNVFASFVSISSVVEEGNLSSERHWGWRPLRGPRMELQRMGSRSLESNLCHWSVMSAQTTPHDDPDRPIMHSTCIIALSIVSVCNFQLLSPYHKLVPYISLQGSGSFDEASSPTSCK